MAPRKPQKPAQPKKFKFDTNTSSNPFVTLKLRGVLLEKFGWSDIQVDHYIQRPRNRNEAKKIGINPDHKPPEPPLELADMQTRGAWETHLANPNRVSATPVDEPRSPALRVIAANHQAFPAGVKGPRKVTKRRATSKTTATTTKRQSTAPPVLPKKVVHFATPDVSEESVNSRESSTEVDLAHDTDKENKMADKPKLKLRLSSLGGSLGPSPESATQRTPSLKLKFNSASSAATPAPKVESPDPRASKSSSKKRKQASVSIQDPPVQHPPPIPLRRLTFKPLTGSEPQPQTPTTPGGIKLKTKGKIPRRPLGVGYDSELDEREIDPVILEGFILRMQPSPDCDYIHTAIETGTIGVSRMQGGAHINIRPLDTQGRRCILVVRNSQYAASMVDLPCIIEGMKSWDKKGFIKSIDICQMLLVLGPCKTDDEARAYPLPDDVNPHTFEYAHGITAPMKWVRKRRFARTKRLRVGDVEAIDRRVRALLEADGEAERTDYDILDHDPRLVEPQYSSTEPEADEEDEEEEEEDADGEAEDYFDAGIGTNGANETPGEYDDTPQEEIADDDVDEFERLIAGGDDDDDDDDEAANGDITQDTTHLMPDVGESSFAVTSTSASPSAAAADTPASAATGGATSDDDDDEDEERDEDERDEDENVQQAKERIQEIEQRIKEQTEILKRTHNAILKRKLAGKITELQGDVAVMKRNIGLGGAEGEDDEE